MSIWNYPGLFTSALKGIVKPSGGGTVNFLCADGNWLTPPGTTYAVFTNVANGLAPLSGGGTAHYLRADGNWITPPDTTYNVFTSVANGLAPLSGGGTVNFLRADGTWAPPPGSGSGWAFIGSTAIVAPVASVPFTGLGSYNELLLFCDAVSASISGTRGVQLSVNGGSSYVANYSSVDAAGTITAVTKCDVHITGATAARSGIIQIKCTNILNHEKFLFRNLPGQSRSFYSAAIGQVDAIQLLNDSGNLNGGTVSLFGR